MEYLSPAEEGMIKLEVKKSRFFARLIPVSSRAEIEEKLNSVRIELKDSSHHCWAYRLMVNEGIEARSSDGGEPSGSAGKPILQSLEEKNFADALIIVSRYFGGIKLGIGGLSRAYRQAARLVIAEAKLIEKHPGKTFKIRFAYQFETGMRNNLQAKMGKII